MPTTLHPARALPRRELVVPVLAIVAVAVLPVLFWSRLPGPVAIHWGLDGRPDGSAPLVVDAVLLTAITALVTLLMAFSVGRADRGVARLMLALSHGLGAFFVLLRWRTIERNLDVAVWTDAGTLGFLDLALLLLLALPVALVGWWLGGRHPELPRPVHHVVAAQLPEDGQLVWTGRQSWTIGRLLGPTLIAAGALTTAVRVAPETLVLGVTLLSAGVLVWGFTTIAVAAGPTGLKVRFGPLGWPLIRVPLASIASVTVEDVEPMAYGGWGYRVLPGVRAVVIRRGIGLRVARPGRADLVVTVDDAPTAAGVLAAHVAAHRRSTGGEGAASSE